MITRSVKRYKKDKSHDKDQIIQNKFNNIYEDYVNIILPLKENLCELISDNYRNTFPTTHNINLQMITGLNICNVIQDSLNQLKNLSVFLFDENAEIYIRRIIDNIDILFTLSNDNFNININFNYNIIQSNIDNLMTSYLRIANRCGSLQILLTNDPYILC